MKEHFSQYYRPTEPEFELLWENCTFVFDTNVLLNLYRYPESIQMPFIHILEAINKRIWIPYQVGLEYQQGRVGVIYSQIKIIDTLTTDFAKEKESLIKKIPESHPFIEIQKLKGDIEKHFTEYVSYIQNANQKPSKLINEDPVRNSIDVLFNGKIGIPLNDEASQKMEEQCHARYKKAIPPGYKDKEIGDCKIWHELMEYSKGNKKDILFITDDLKEDWWLIQNGETIGPRPELIKEFQTITSQKFYMYNFKHFLQLGSKKYLKTPIDKESIDEIQKIKKMNEIKEKNSMNAFAKYEDNKSQHDNFIREIEIELRETEMRLFSYEDQFESLTRELNAVNDRIRESTREISRYSVDSEKNNQIAKEIVVLEENRIHLMDSREHCRMMIRSLNMERDKLRAKVENLLIPREDFSDHNRI